MMGAFASLAASRAATTVLERETVSLFPPKSLTLVVWTIGRRYWVIHPAQYETSNPFVSPAWGLCLFRCRLVLLPHSTTCAWELDSVWRGRRSGVRTNLELVTLQAGMANCFSRA